LNTQPIEKSELSSDGTLDVHGSPFYTIQGEGPNCGQPAIFIRLAGCNLQCPGCDTDYTSTRKRMSVAILRAAVDTLKEDEYPDAPKPLVVITGGEPFRQNITHICISLLKAGYRVQIETNGTLAPSAGLPFEVEIVCSPKTGKINDGIAARVKALKYVVKAGLVVPRDGLPIRALDHTCSPSVAKPPGDYAGRIYIQPMDEGRADLNRRNLEAAKNSCLQHGHTLQMQVHKLIGVE
jgi:7-carboxy-7-deazaguanine synthase